uniref:Type I restriction enzyme R protein N-terminal domain-containing protein n=1 Tax=Ignisphaera aggregans TaxID=334771 RepID=A0A7J3YTB7_9CREN
MELEELIRKLKRKLRRYKELYSQNEAAVREHIISPLLRVLKWNPEDPKQIIPEYPVIITERGKRKRIKLDYALMRHNALFAVIEVKALGKVDEGLGQAFISAQATGARYIIITDGDTWRLYDTSKPITKALVCEWSLLRETSVKVANKVQIIANTKNFGILRRSQRREKKLHNSRSQKELRS